MKIPPQIAKKVLFATIFGYFTMLSGCVNEEFDPSTCPIVFTSSIDALDSPSSKLAPPTSPQPKPPSFPPPTAHSNTPHTTRAANADWHTDDLIGIYMVDGGGTIAENSLAANVPHRHTGSGNFNAEADGELFYPRLGKVDFVAYYPWRTTYEDHRYPVDVADQSDHPAIDFMYSDNAAGHSGGDVPLLVFHHKLSKLVFNVTDMTGAALDDLDAVISGLSTCGVFNLSEGRLALDPDSEAPIEPARYNDGDNEPSTARLEAIVLPETAISPVVDFTLPDGETARLRPVEKEYMSGKVYIYEVTITEGGQVSFGGGTVIVDWDDEDRAPGHYQIPKEDPDGPDDPDDPDPSEEKTRYFFETCGSGGNGGGEIDDRPKIDDYTGWDNSDGVEFSDRLGGADIRRFGSLDTHIYFPADGYSDLAITGLPADRSDITLSYDIAAEEGGVRAGIIAVYADAVNVTKSVTATIPSPNRYVHISIDITSGTSSLRFVSDPEVNTCGARIDNISLEGRQSE